MNIDKLFNEFPIIDCRQYILSEITESDTKDIYEIYSDYENVIYDRKKPFSEMKTGDFTIKPVGNHLLKRRLLISLESGMKKERALRI